MQPSFASGYNFTPTNQSNGTPFPTATLTSTTAIICRRNNAGAGVAFIATRSGTTFSYGSEYTFEAAIDYASGAVVLDVTAMDSTHAIVMYRKNNGGLLPHAMCLTISGNTITGNGAAVVLDGDPYTNYAVTFSISALSSSVAVATFNRTDSGLEARAVAMSLSGQTITAGASVQVSTSTSLEYLKVAGMDSTHAIVTGWNSYFYGVIGYCLTLSGLTISVSSYTMIRSGSGITANGLAMMDSSHAVSSWLNFDTYDVKAVCLSLSGSTIAVGTAITPFGATCYGLIIGSMSSTKVVVVVSNGSYTTDALYLTLNNVTLTAGTSSNVGTYIVMYDITNMDGTHALMTELEYTGAPNYYSYGVGRDIYQA